LLTKKRNFKEIKTPRGVVINNLCRKFVANRHFLLLFNITATEEEEKKT